MRGQNHNCKTNCKTCRAAHALDCCIKHSHEPDNLSLIPSIFPNASGGRAAEIQMPHIVQHCNQIETGLSDLQTSLLSLQKANSMLCPCLYVMLEAEQWEVVFTGLHAWEHSGGWGARPAGARGPLGNRPGQAPHAAGVLSGGQPSRAAWGLVCGAGQ